MELSLRECRSCNGWDDAQKLQLPERPSRRGSSRSRGTRTEFQARCKKSSEGWADFSEEQIPRGQGLPGPAGRGSGEAGPQRIPGSAAPAADSFQREAKMTYIARRCGHRHTGNGIVSSTTSHQLHAPPDIRRYCCSGGRCRGQSSSTYTGGRETGRAGGEAAAKNGPCAH